MVARRLYTTRVRFSVRVRVVVKGAGSEPGLQNSLALRSGPESLRARSACHLRVRYADSLSLVLEMLDAGFHSAAHAAF